MRSDNGKEFTAEALQEWLKNVGVEPIQIYPGSPLENGYNGAGLQDLADLESQFTRRQCCSIAYTLIDAANPSGVSSRARLADTLTDIPNYKITKID